MDELPREIKKFLLHHISYLSFTLALTVLDKQFCMIYMTQQVKMSFSARNRMPHSVIPDLQETDVEGYTMRLGGKY